MARGHVGLFTLEQNSFDRVAQTSAVILSVFGTALRAWWDDDAPRLGASLSWRRGSSSMIIETRKFVEAVSLHRWAFLKSEQPRVFNGIRGDGRG